MQNDYAEYLKSSGIYEVACRDFVDSQKNTIDEISKAIDANDFKSAHFHAHSLKGRAGLLGENMLMELAEKAEKSFREEKVPTEIMPELMQELARVFAIAEKYIENKITLQLTVLDKEKARDIFDRLILLLEANSFDAVNMISEILEIPQTDVLISQIEMVDFTQALETIKHLRKILEV